jgi:hypothetical protein
MTARIKIFTDAKSKLSNVVLSDLDIQDPLSGQKSSGNGYSATEGIYIQDLGSHNIPQLTFTNVAIDGARSYAVDSSKCIG